MGSNYARQGKHMKERGVKDRRIVKHNTRRVARRAGYREVLSRLTEAEQGELLTKIDLEHEQALIDNELRDLFAEFGDEDDNDNDDDCTCCCCTGACREP